MVVGDDIAVRADDYTRAATPLFPGLAKTITVSESEEELKRVYGAGLALDGYLYIYYGLHGRLCCVGEVRII